MTAAIRAAILMITVCRTSRAASCSAPLALWPANAEQTTQAKIGLSNPAILRSDNSEEFARIHLIGCNNLLLSRFIDHDKPASSMEYHVWIGADAWGNRKRSRGGSTSDAFANTFAAIDRLPGRFANQLICLSLERVNLDGNT